MKTVQSSQPLQPVNQNLKLKGKKTAGGRILYECGGTQFCVEERYECTKQIGHGAYGVVCSGTDLQKNKKIAIKKVIDKLIIYCYRFRMPLKIQWMQRGFQEKLRCSVNSQKIIFCLEFFQHENIISLVDVLKPETRTGYNDIYIVTELMETDLHRVIYSRQELTEEHIQYFMYQTLRGLLFLHSANVIHRDLKPSNILVNKNCDLKICDLGLARGFEQEDENKTEYVVTRWYRAPEVILQASEYTKGIDIWSIGCIFAELLGRTPLFPGKDYLEQIQRIIAVLGSPSNEEMAYITNEGAIKYIKSLPKRSKQPFGVLFPKISTACLDLIAKMLTFSPNQRYTVEQCLNHPYFEGLHNPDDEPVSKVPFDWQWDKFELKKDVIQAMVYDEAVSWQQKAKYPVKKL